MVGMDQILGALGGANEYFQSPQWQEYIARSDAIHSGQNPSQAAQEHAYNQAAIGAQEAETREKQRKQEIARVLPGMLQGLKGKSPQEIFEVLSPLLGVEEAFKVAKNASAVENASKPNVQYKVDALGNLIGIDEDAGTADYLPIGEDGQNQQLESLDGLDGMAPPPPGLSPSGKKTWQDNAIKQKFELDAAKPKVQKGAQSIVARMQDSIGIIDKELPKIGYTTAGIGGAILSSIPGTAATDLEGQIDTLVARSGFGELQEMRDNSPTGGALGQVSERELSLLQAVTRNLKISQSPDQLRENLEAFKKQLSSSRDKITQAYEKDFGVSLELTKPLPNSANEAGITQEEWDSLSEEEQAVW